MCAAALPGQTYREDVGLVEGQRMQRWGKTGRITCFMHTGHSLTCQVECFTCQTDGACPESFPFIPLCAHTAFLDVSKYPKLWDGRQSLNLPIGDEGRCAIVFD